MELDVLTQVNSVILLTGESGTGKTKLAEKIHSSSSRKDKPLIRINLATLNKNLIESELFGHIKGAFTGSLQDKMSPLELVKNGTLFLDEIGELDLSLQSKLLDLIERKTFYKVGAVKESRFEGTIIAATNKDLEAEIEKEKFRADLYYRLRIFHKKLNPLRENSNKMEVILEQISRRNLIVSADVLETLLDYPWPGNYRELLNTLDLIETTEKVKKFEKNHLPKWFFQPPQKKEESEYKKVLELFEKRFIADKLNENHGNILNTAKALRLSRSTLTNKLRKFELL